MISLASYPKNHHGPKPVHCRKEYSRQAERERAYRSVLGGFGLATLERHTVTFVLETLGRDEALDAGGFGVGFLAFAFGLDFAADDELADLVVS